MKKKLLSLLMIITTMCCVATGCTLEKVEKDEPNIDNVDLKIDDESESESESEEESETEEAMTLEAYYYDIEANRKALDDVCNTLLQSNSATFSNIEWEVEGNVFSYIYTVNIDDSLLEQYKESLKKSAETMDLDSTIEQMHEESGVDDEITIVFKYVSNSGTEILEVKKQG